MKFFEKEWKGKFYKFYAQREGDKLWLHFKGRSWLWSKRQDQKPTLETPVLKKPKTVIKASLPGKIQKIFVQKSSPIKKGQELLLLSSMKIEYHFIAEAEGQVEELFCKEGDIVEENQALLRIKYKPLPESIRKNPHI